MIDLSARSPPRASCSHKKKHDFRKAAYVHKTRLAAVDFTYVVSALNCGEKCGAVRVLRGVCGSCERCCERTVDGLSDLRLDNKAASLQTEAEDGQAAEERRGSSGPHHVADMGINESNSECPPLTPKSPKQQQHHRTRED